MTVQLSLVQTCALALGVLLLGNVLNRFIPFLRNNNIPEPVVGGIAFAVISTILYSQFEFSFAYDMALKTPLMLVFFTTVGLGASIKLLIRGGPKVLLFLAIATAYLVVQNGTGVLLAMATDMHPLIGLLAGSITLSGGHGTGVTYAEIFTDVHNIRGTMELAMACATFGLVLGGLIGGPVTRRLIERNKLRPEEYRHQQTREEITYDLDEQDDVTPRRMIETITIIALCMVVGDLLYRYLNAHGVTVPSFICSLFLGLAITNFFDFSGLYRINKETVDLWGTVSLSIFLAMALMSLRLWELVNLAGPMLLILAAQCVIMVLFAYFITFRVMGKDYDAAIMSGGHCGFGLGATPTAVANMEALVSRYGPSPQSFLVVPMVGAFFIDIANALVIQLYFVLPGIR
jgi:glutamate:Na+ symporter, ESS family